MYLHFSCSQLRKRHQVKPRALESWAENMPFQSQPSTHASAPVPVGSLRRPAKSGFDSATWRRSARERSQSSRHHSSGCVFPSKLGSSPFSIGKACPSAACSETGQQAQGQPQQSKGSSPLPVCSYRAPHFQKKFNYTASVPLTLSVKVLQVFKHY